jgi:hypothetical protein
MKKREKRVLLRCAVLCCGFLQCELTVTYCLTILPSYLYLMSNPKETISAVARNDPLQQAAYSSATDQNVNKRTANSSYIDDTMINSTVVNTSHILGHNKTSQSRLIKEEYLLSSIPHLYNPLLHKIRYEAERHKYIKYSIIQATSNLAQAKTLLTKQTNKYWTVGSGIKHELLLKLDAPALIGWVKIHNKSTNSCEVFTAYDNANKQFLHRYKDDKLPHNKISMFPCGYLPGRFIKLRLNTGRPISLYSIEIVGVPIHNSTVNLGSELHNLLIEHPAALMRPVVPSLYLSDSLRYPLDQASLPFNKEIRAELKEETKNQSISASLCDNSKCRVENVSCITHNPSSLYASSYSFSAKTSQQFHQHKHYGK